MKNYIRYILMGAAIVSMTSCDDFLDKQPETSIVAETFFTSADNIAAYTQNLYTILPSHSDASYGIGTFSFDNNTDNQATMNPSDRWAPGFWLTGTGEDNWSFTNLRSINFMLENTIPEYEAGNISGDINIINQTLGEAYFFRAYIFYTGYKTIGDYPIILETLPDDKEVLLEASVRYPRNQVARQILNDLTQAINYLPETSSKGKNGINKAVAQLFRSRVALFEGTWLKYHKGTALVPGGPGWPGDQSMLNGFNIDSEISYFLNEALTSAKPVADAIYGNLVPNSGEIVGQNTQYQSQNQYYTMYCEQNLDGYSEVLMYRYYQMGLISTQIQNQLELNGCGTGWTRGMVNSYVMRNGLPIYASGSGYNPNWENDGITATLQNRDSRIQIFTKQDSCIDYYNSNTLAPVYFDLASLMTGTAETRAVTGYAIKKGKSYDYTQAAGNNQTTTGSITFRATEAMLNYMEADYELNGSVSGTSASYWQALRRRALVNEDFNVTIAATDMSQEALGDWGAYSAGSLINPTLYNIRRERRNELMAEGFRYDDLRRWAALDQMISTPYFIEGMKYWGTVYNDPTSPLALYRMVDDQKEFLEPIYGTDNGTSNMSDPSYGPYVRPYQINHQNNNCWDGYRWTRAHYLSPIGAQAFANASPDGTIDNSVIYQNPGWPRQGGLPANDIN